MTIHTFGDSHSVNGFVKIKNVKTHHLGSILCYSFGMEDLSRCDITKFDLQDDDTVVFCFGEIDCRCHIHKHITSDLSYKIIIDTIVENYSRAIKINLEKTKVKLKNICIYNVLPPANKDTAIGESSLPYLGTNEERKKYTLYFNERLRKICGDNDWIFLDIYDSYADSNGLLRSDLSDISVHIKNEIYLANFIEKYLL